MGEWKREAFEKWLVGAGTRARVAQHCWRGFAQILRVTCVGWKGICSWFDFFFFLSSPSFCGTKQVKSAHHLADFVPH